MRSKYIMMVFSLTPSKECSGRTYPSHLWRLTENFVYLPPRRGRDFFEERGIQLLHEESLYKQTPECLIVHKKPCLKEVVSLPRDGNPCTFWKLMIHRLAQVRAQRPRLDPILGGYFRKRLRRCLNFMHPLPAERRQIRLNEMEPRVLRDNTG